MIKLIKEFDEFDQIKKRSERGNADIKKAADILGITVRDLINDAADFVGKDAKSITAFDVAHLVNSCKGYEAAKSVFKESKVSHRRRTMKESTYQLMIPHQLAHGLEVEISKGDYELTVLTLMNCWKAIHDLIPDEYSMHDLDKNLIPLDIMYRKLESGESANPKYEINCLLDDFYDFCDKSGILCGSIGNSRKFFNERLGIRKKKVMKESAGGTVVLSGLNTDVIPVVDFGCYWGPLKDALDDVFVYDFIELDNIDPDDEYYDEIVELVDEKYDGSDEFYNQVLRYAPKTIQDAFNEYGIEMQVIPSSCKWYHPREYNFGDDCIEFDAKVNTAWVENKFREFSGNPDFSKFLKKEFSSYDGFISFMPDDVDSYSDILDPNSSDYWKAVSAIVGYIISLDPSIREDATEGLYEDVICNADFVRCSSLDIY